MPHVRVRFRLTNNFRSIRGDDRFTSEMAKLRPRFDVVVESAVEGIRKER